MKAVPATFSKAPRTALTIMWRTENWTLLWTGSMVHSAASAAAAGGV